MSRTITAYWLGRMAYDRAHALQEKLLEARIKGDVGDVVLLLEHDPVITLGRGAKKDNVIATTSERRERGVALVETARGGDVTFHGPGQLVCYPIINLCPDRCDVRKYVHDLATIMIGLARDHGVCAGVIPGSQKHIGVWVDESDPAQWDSERALAASAGEPNGMRLAKIGAIGVRLSRWITMHGFAFNVATDLEGFGLIVPCGIRQLGVTSLKALGQRVPTLGELAKQAHSHFARVFDADVREGCMEYLQDKFGL
ncbi:MAG: lipoyl(octanoyl) transferase LipB [Polyangiaceae bacterium]|nr:lipoyl(octanoyl) transferase LipB [Polyangiaceae bacterium]